MYVCMYVRMCIYIYTKEFVWLAGVYLQGNKNKNENNKQRDKTNVKDFYIKDKTIQ